VVLTNRAPVARHDILFAPQITPHLESNVCICVRTNSSGVARINFKKYRRDNFKTLAKRDAAYAIKHRKRIAKRLAVWRRANRKKIAAYHAAYARAMDGFSAKKLITIVLSRVNVRNVEGVLSCPACASGKQSEFPSEMLIHLPGLKNVDNPGVRVSQKILICLDCGFASLTVQKAELARLAAQDGIKSGEQVSARHSFDNVALRARS